MKATTQSNIKQIYKNYFEITDSFFGSIKHYLGEEKDSYIDFGNFMVSYPLIFIFVVDAIEDLDE